MSDWYLARQLENFQHGLRGAHPQDFYGAQMALGQPSRLADATTCDRRPALSYINDSAVSA